jgi:hypothetical protein
MLERDYSSVTPHVEQESPPEANFTLEADTYEKLVIGILYFVNRHMETGTIRFSNYEGDINEAVQTACLEVTRGDPIGAFAVDYITSDVVRIVSYYEADLTIAYKQTQADLKDMIPVTGNLTMKRELDNTLNLCSERVVFYNTSFSGDEADIKDLVREAYFENPAAAMGYPDVDVKLYPEDGAVRVVEIKLDYPLEKDTFMLRRNTVLDAALRLTESFAGQSEEEIADLFCSSLQEMAAKAGDGEAPCTTAWDVLMEGRGDSEGFSLTYKLLCDQAGLSCYVVSGLLNGFPHFWNIVTIAEKSYHIDAFSEDPTVIFVPTLI